MSGPSFPQFDERPDQLAPGGPLALWRDPAPDAVAMTLADPFGADALAALVARVRPAAREIARVLDLGEKPALVGAALDAGHGARRQTSLADDLVATALLLEGARGDPTARLVVDYLRRRRGLAPLRWLSRQTRRVASRSASTPAFDEKPRG